MISNELKEIINNYSDKEFNKKLEIYCNKYFIKQTGYYNPYKEINEICYEDIYQGGPLCPLSVVLGYGTLDEVKFVLGKIDNIRNITLNNSLESQFLKKNNKERYDICKLLLERIEKIYNIGNLDIFCLDYIKTKISTEEENLHTLIFLKMIKGKQYDYYGMIIYYCIYKYSYSFFNNIINTIINDKLLTTNKNILEFIKEFLIINNNSSLNYNNLIIKLIKNYDIINIDIYYLIYYCCYTNNLEVINYLYKFNLKIDKNILYNSLFCKKIKSSNINFSVTILEFIIIKYPEFIEDIEKYETIFNNFCTELEIENIKFLLHKRDLYENTINKFNYQNSFNKLFIIILKNKTFISEYDKKLKLYHSKSMEILTLLSNRNIDFNNSYNYLYNQYNNLFIKKKYTRNFYPISCNEIFHIENIERKFFIYFLFLINKCPNLLNLNRLKEETKLNNFLKKLYILKIKKIQKFLKKNIYNPHTKIGNKFAKNQIKWAFN